MPATPRQAASQHTMRLAEILADLASLRVCDPPAALALVSARAACVTSSSATTAPAWLDTSSTLTPLTTAATPGDRDKHDADDLDLHRAKELLRLHFDVKQAAKRGDLARVLEESRVMVGRAVSGV